MSTKTDSNVAKEGAEPGCSEGISAEKGPDPQAERG